MTHLGFVLKKVTFPVKFFSLGRYVFSDNYLFFLLNFCGSPFWQVIYSLKYYLFSNV